MVGTEKNLAVGMQLIALRDDTRGVSAKTEMSEKPKIIYVPDAHKFTLGEFLIGIGRSIGDPALNVLRDNYRELRQHVNLPEKVGVVTYFSAVNGESRKYVAQLEQDFDIKTTTTYVPLEILERMFKIREEIGKDNDDLLKVEYHYRALTALSTDTSIYLDKGIPAEKRNGLLVASAIPAASKAMRTCASLKEKMPEAHTIIEESVEVLKGLASWERLERLYGFVKARFAANKVSKEFPLHYQPQGWFSPTLYGVSLVERVETGKGFTEMMESLRAGYLALGQTNIPQDTYADIAKLYKKDWFGEMTIAADLKELLRDLPSPQTIITDIYIADAFPELARTGFEACEIK